MQVTVLTPDQELYNGESTGVVVPGISGSFEILNNHAPIVSALGKGQVVVTSESGEKKVFDIHKGFVEVLKNQVSILVQGVRS